MSEDYTIRPDEEDVVHNYTFRHKVAAKKEIAAHPPIQSTAFVRWYCDIDGIKHTQEELSGFIPAAFQEEFKTLVGKKIAEAYNEIYEKTETGASPA